MTDIETKRETQTHKQTYKQQRQSPFSNTQFAAINPGTVLSTLDRDMKRWGSALEAYT